MYGIGTSCSAANAIGASLYQAMVHQAPERSAGARAGQLLLDERREIFQCSPVGVAEVARPVVAETQRPDAVGADADRMASVEPDTRLAGDERVVGEARIEPGVRDDERVVAVNRVGTERRLPRRLANVDAARGLEPLPLLVDEGHQRHRHVEGPPGQA